MANKNVLFLDSIDDGTKEDILANIATHYDITPSEACLEISDQEAEAIFEYMVGPERLATYTLMSRRGFVSA